MTLTNNQKRFAFDRIVRELLKTGPVTFTKQEIKQSIINAEAWAELNATKSGFNSKLKNNRFKTNATSDQKRIVLIYALLAIVNG